MFQLKVCQQCGTVCESTVHWCPECQARKFQKIIMKELIEKSGNKKIRIYFKQWPNWPSESAWQEVYHKEDLLPATKKNIFLRFIDKIKTLG